MDKPVHHRVAELQRQSHNRPSTSGHANAEHPSSQSSQRGRPSIEIDASTERGLIRLFTCTGVTLERIAAAFQKLGGPRRMWLRRRFAEITGARKLKQLRPHAEELDSVSAPECVLCQSVRQSSIRSSYEQYTVPETGDSINGTNTVGTGSETNSPFTLNKDSSRMSDFPDEDFTESAWPIITSDLLSMTDKSSVPATCQRIPSDSSAGDTSSISTSSSMAANSLHENIPSTRKRKLAAMKGNNGKGKKCPTLTQVALDLDKGEPGRYYHLAKCCSVWNTTISSRWSYNMSRCITRTKDSEFERFYSKGQDTAPVSTSEMDGATPSSATGEREIDSSTHKTVVDILLNAHTRSLLDHKVEQELRNILPMTDKDRLRELVNAADEYGVAPLHLSTAYGYPATCTLLIESEARLDAQTASGTGISDFAKPAQTMAGRRDEKELYFRIMHCRKHIEAGLDPKAAKARLRSDRTRVGHPNKLKKAIRTRIPINSKAADRAQGEVPDEHFSQGTGTTNNCSPQVTAWTNDMEDGTLSTMHSQRAQSDYQAPMTEDQPWLDRPFTNSPCSSLFMDPSMIGMLDATLSAAAQTATDDCMQSAVAQSDRNFTQILNPAPLFYDNPVFEHDDMPTWPVLHPSPVVSAEPNHDIHVGFRAGSLSPSFHSSELSEFCILPPNAHWSPRPMQSELSASRAPVTPQEMRFRPLQRCYQPQAYQHEHAFQQPVLSSNTHNHEQNHNTAALRRVSNLGVSNRVAFRSTTSLGAQALYYHCVHNQPRDFETSYCEHGCPRLRDEPAVGYGNGPIDGSGTGLQGQR